MALDLIRLYITTPSELRSAGKWKVVIAGAGISGLCMAKKLLDVGVKNFVILEKSSSLGGTWRENVYPGVACDVVSHSYSFSFFANPWWSRLYSGGREIWSYLDSCVSHFGLHEQIRYDQKITAVTWSEKSKMWEIQTEKGEKLEANFFIHATGGLHDPNKPAFKNQSLFKKPIFHTAEWDQKQDLTGKRVAVIGTGASAVQVVPSIAGKVKELYLFQRTPAWVPRKHDYEYWTWVKYMFHWLPWTNTAYRLFQFLYGEFLYQVLIRNGFLRRVVKSIITRMMLSSLRANPQLSEALIPQYEPGCKRITPSDHYLQALQRENVHLVQESIREFTAEGIVTEGRDSPYELDVIILATGFDVTAMTRSYECTGRYSRRLDTSWGDSPAAYLGVATPGFPNLFFLLGPSTMLSLGSAIFMVECQVEYVIDCIRKLVETDGAMTIEVKANTLERYMEFLKANLAKTVWTSGCSSYNQNESGFVWTGWPKSSTEFWWRTYSCEEEDYNFC